MHAEARSLEKDCSRPNRRGSRGVRYGWVIGGIRYLAKRFDAAAPAKPAHLDRVRRAFDARAEDPATSNRLVVQNQIADPQSRLVGTVDAHHLGRARSLAHQESPVTPSRARTNRVATFRSKAEPSRDTAARIVTMGGPAAGAKRWRIDERPGERTRIPRGRSRSPGHLRFRDGRAIGPAAAPTRDRPQRGPEPRAARTRTNARTAAARRSRAERTRRARIRQRRGRQPRSPVDSCGCRCHERRFPGRADPARSVQ